MSKYQLAIEDTVEVHVKFTVKSKGIAKPFAVTLMATRLDQTEINERLANKDKTVTAFMAEVVIGWSGQRLVLGEDGAPADFSPEALDLLLGVTGVAGLCFTAYLKECAAKEKN